MQTPQNRLAAPPEAMDDDPSVAAVMTPRIVAITPDAPLHTGLRLMASGNVRHLPVIDAAGCRGVVLETDLVNAVAIGTPALVGPLARPVPTLPVTRRRSEAAQAMLAGDVDAVLITDDDRLVGIVTATDMVRSLAQEAARS